MKQGIHPDYKLSKVTCSSCGAEWQSHSTGGDVRVDICSNCHPFYTGRQNIVDTEGRIERFRNKYARRAEAQAMGPKKKRERS